MAYSKSYENFLKKLDERETMARGGRSPGASATSQDTKVSVKNERAAAFLKRIGIDDDMELSVDHSDIKPFNQDVRALGTSVKKMTFPSQYEENKAKYGQLKTTGEQLEIFANPQITPVQADVFRGNYTLGNIGKQLDASALGSYANDTAFLQENTEDYAQYQKYVQAAMESGDPTLQRDVLQFGMGQQDTRPDDGRMTLDEIDTEINSIIAEIEAANKKQYEAPAVFDPMGVMDDLAAETPVETDDRMTLEEINAELNTLVKPMQQPKPEDMPRIAELIAMKESGNYRTGNTTKQSTYTPAPAKVDTSAQEARLRELLAMKENGNYITDEEIAQTQQNYLDRYNEQFVQEQKEVDLQDSERLDELDRMLRTGYAADYSRQLTQDEMKAAQQERESILMREEAVTPKKMAQDYGLLPKPDWGKYLWTGVKKGYTDFINAAYQTYDVVLGKAIDNTVNLAKDLFGGNTEEKFRNPLSQWADTYKGLNAKYNREASEAAAQMGGSVAWQVGHEIMGGLIQNVPNTVLAFLTGGASMGASGLQNAATKAMSAAGNSKTVQAVQNMITNPQYWTSFAQTIGNDYNQALEESGDPLKAALYATGVGLVNAGIEIGATGTSGIQGINHADDGTNIINRAAKALTGKDLGAFSQIIDSASDESLEELQQGIVSGLAEKVIYDAEKPYISMEDENAIISPETGKQMIVGAATGGLLAGGAAATNAAVGAYQDRQIQKEFEDAVNAYFNEEAPVSRDAEALATEGTAAETAPTGENMQPQSAFEKSGEETAYEYGLSGRSQEEAQETLESVGIPMTGKERVAYTKGETRRQQIVLERRKLIDEKNRGGANGTRQGTFRSISKEEIAMLEERGIKVNAFNGVFSDKQRKAGDALRKVAETMHMNLVYFESPTDADGNRVGANGFYDREYNTVYLDVFAGKGNEQAMMKAAAHELTHVIQQWAPEKYKTLQDGLIKYYYSTGKNTLRELVQAQLDKAKKAGNALSESEAMDEITADACEMMFGDIEAMREIAATDRTLFEKIGEWINKFVDTIKTAMEGLRAGTRESALLMESKQAWENARNTWYQALEEAGRANAGLLDVETESETPQRAPARIIKAQSFEKGGMAGQTVTTDTESTPGAKTYTKPVQLTKQALPTADSMEGKPASNKGTAYTADNKAIDYHYEVVNADDLIASNTTGFEVNEAYPQELQPRDRQRQASRDQVWDMARNLNPVRLGESADVQNGAPIIGADRVVESGNGRVLATQLAMKYGEKSAKNYTEWLKKNAASFGIDPNTVGENSVLVRVRDSNVDRTQFVKEANESTTASYSESESAQSDSEKLTPEMLELFVPSETGRIDTSENHSFVSRFIDRVIPRTERGSYVQQDGGISQRGWTRLRNAIFQKAYGSSQLTGALSEATEDGTKNVIRAMTNAAPQMVLTQESVKKQQLYDVQLPQAMTEAARRYAQLKRDGLDVSTYLAQEKMPGLEQESAGAQALMRLFDKYKQSTKQLTQAISTVMDVLEEYGEPNQVSMFGEREAPELASIVSQAMQRMDSGRVQFSQRDTEAKTEPTREDLEVLRAIGRKSINDFTAEQVQQTEVWARKFWNELKEKSPFFRRWFGDWRAYDNLTKTAIVTADEKAVAKGGKISNTDMNRIISWSKDIVNDSVKHATMSKKSQVRVIANNIERIVQNAVLLDTVVSEETKKSKMPGTAFMHSLYTLVKTENGISLIKLYAEEALHEKTGEIFTRAYNVLYIEKVADMAEGVHSENGGLTLKATATDISIAELYDLVKKFDDSFMPHFANPDMLNTDDTPKKVYHGTPSYGFTVFDKNLMGKGTDQFGAGFYFATDKKAAESYGDKQYEVYLSIKKPIKIERTLDGGDLYEVEITQQQAYQILKRRPDIMDPEESPLGDFVEEYWSEGPKDWMIREMAKNYQTIGDLDGDRSAFREYPNELHEAIRDVMGYDGVEVSFDNTEGKFYVAWFPEQIKSATDNIGTFDGSNPDIRFSQRDTEYKTDRQLLASALEGVTKDADEAQMLREYQDIAAKLDADERRVQEINVRIRELRLEDVNTPEEQKLLEERRELEKGITKADRKLFQMERLKPLQRIAQIQRKEAEAALSRAKRHLERYKEGVEQREYIGRIKKTSDRLSKWLTQPNNQRFVPEAMRKPLAEFLLAIDRGSATMLSGGGMTKADRDYARVIADLRDVISKIDAYQNGDEENGASANVHFDLPHGFAEMMTEMVDMLKTKSEALGGNLTLNRMNSEELETLYKTLVAINTSIVRSNEFLSTAGQKKVDEVAKKSVDYLNEQKERKVELPGADFITWKNTQPIYAFERFGEGGKEVFRMLQTGQSKLAFNTKKILAATKDLYTSKQVRKWSNEKKTFTLNGQEVSIPITHIMSLYCISKRAQGKTHLYGEGIRIADTQRGPVRLKGAQSKVTEAEVNEIISSLTEEQRAVADKLQKLMTTLGAQWGNEVSMKRFGFRMFTEPHYFPLRTVPEGRAVTAEGTRGNELYRLLNISSTKPIVKGAKNMILLDNIFDVFATHMSDMAQYNALALPVLDAVKWLNYKETEDVIGEDGKKTSLFKDSVRNAARLAYGNVANNYIVQLLKDVNGAKMTGGEDTIGLKMLGRQNRAAVAANLRVVMLQPLSIIRAGAVLGDMSIVKGLTMGPAHIIKNFKEMNQYSGISVWKELGFYDVNISRGVKQMIKNDQSLMEKGIEATMWGASVADHVTWGLMWEATKRKVAKTMNPSADGYMEKVAELFEEVVYKTQVVDSVLTKSEFMRGKSFWSKMSSSFMSEPTTSFNMVMDAHYKLLQDMKSSRKRGLGRFQEAWTKNKNGKKLMHTMSIFTMSALVSTMIEQLFSAYRDEDDYETFMEKYKDGMLDTFVNNMVLVNKIPILKDVWEMGKSVAAIAGVDTFGYENETVIGGIASNLTKAVQIHFDLQEGNPTNYTKWGRTYKGLQVISDVTGVPFAGMAREVTALYNATIAPSTGRKIVVYQTGKSVGYQQLYEAIQSGNAEREAELFKELEGNGVDAEEIESGLRKLAKEDWTTGNMTDKEAIAFLVKYNDMKEDEAYWKIEEWGYKGEDEDDRFSVYSTLEDALLSGNGIDAAIKELTTHGYETTDVQSKVRSIVKEAYIDGDLSQSKAESYLKKYGNVKTDNDVWFKIQQYNYEKLTKDSTSSDVCMVFYAIDNKKSPQNAIQDAIKHGKTKEGIASSLTSHYKPIYLKMLQTNKSEAYQLGTRLAGIFGYLGYKGTEKVKNWEKDKNKTASK